MSGEHGEVLTILIADDNNDVRAVVRQFLEQFKHRVLEAVNGQEAVDIAHREHPNIILMDLNMPALDGLAAARLIRQQETLQTTPIIAITAHGSYGIDFYSEIDDLGPGRIEYLAKPFTLDQLSDLIRRTLQSS